MRSSDAILDRIRAQGMPNFYGPQRFGRDGGTVDLGLQCLAGKAPRRIRPFLFRFALSAVQSLLFNDYLARRLNDGLFRTVLEGDVMAKWPIGGMFVAKDVAAEQARFDARETVTAGPMFGKKTFPTEGPAAEREAAVLRDHKTVARVVRGVRQAGTRHAPAQSRLPRRPRCRVGTGRPAAVVHAPRRQLRDGAARRGDENEHCGV